ncbi:Putative serine or threonine protein kinase [Streptomyces venezuelae]|uniref:serine/threonine-protein kinase n=1 Tax=Streptomyces gardneri TaxID=66892 RepID=UPI0006BD4102|nr:serine/threonine-protein kinase [Streptomyces gardneri]ALO08740.1 Putative serine or threonine protein kinase [Streptomyces venezuelae]QPK45924.1 protein kinase [Streptomyces gardneri]WRK37276.1 protein kinase [Streptomyces venezuelae]CUM40881.1 putative serine/threonine protein kinase [Streptomyces venezuelae]
MLSPLTHDDPAAVATYRLLARLGSGGMGTVYLARTPGGRTVALKTVHARLATDPAFRARFRLETDAARIIGARHGAAVVDADPLAETPWLATEYVLGPPLDDAVALGGPLPEPTVRALGAALAGALAQLHSSDVVHRDLKPSNVLVTAYGPKIIDFGIARAAGDDHLTRTGAAAGTPAFMSPEQASGQEHPPAGDVFALAGVLVFAASGHGPFGTGSPADLLYRVRYAEPDLTGVPEALLPLLTACLAKDPAARPTTADLIAHLHDGHGEFADHLPPLLLADIARRATDVWLHAPHRLPAPAGAAFAETAPSTPLSRRRALTLGSGSVLGLAGAGAGVWAWLNSRDTEGGTATGGTPSPTGPTAIPATTASDGAPAALWRGESLDREESITPLLAGDVVGFAETVSFRALDTGKGTELWTDSMPNPNQIVTDGTYFYASEGPSDGPSALQIRTIAPRTGKDAARKIELKGFEGSMFGTDLLTASGGRIFAASRIGNREDDKAIGRYMISVDLRTGKELWRQPHAWGNARPWLSQVVGDLLVLGKNSDDLKSFDLQARDVRTGRQLWRRSVPFELSVYYSPGQLATDDRHVYVGGDRLRALRLADGVVAWEHGKGSDFGFPVVSGGLVHVNESGRGLVVVSADKGVKRWEETPSGRSLTPELRSVPVVGTTYVYAPVQGGLSAVDPATRRSAWVFPTDATRYVVDRKRTRILGAGASSVVAIPFA